LERRTRRGLREKLRSQHEAHGASWSLRRKMGPQAVPRGFLRMYMLALLSLKPQNGYSVMRHIHERTQGSWRPGPGTVYPMLKTMAREGLIKALDRGGREDSVAYSVTAKGRSELDDMQREMVRRGSEGQAMMGLVGELFPPAHFTTFFKSHFGKELELFAEKAIQLPKDEQELLLKEVELVLERHLAWIRNQLAQK
jgi:DNA-binding PadR family transcriptional regulator